MQSYSDVAIVSGKKNLDGRLVIKASAGLPFLLEEDMSVHFVPPQLDVPRRATIEDVAMQSEEAAIVSFDSVDCAEFAEALIGCHVLVASSELPEGIWREAGSFASGKLFEGWKLRDSNTNLTFDIEEVDGRSGQMLCNVVDENGKQYLIPLAEELVKDIDEDAQEVVVDCPNGIFEL